MNPRCVAAVNAAAGRPLTAGQIKKIDDAIVGQSRRLAAADPTRWRGLTAEERTLEAAQAAMTDLQAEAALKHRRGVMQVLKTADVEQRITDLGDAFKGDSRQKLLVRDMENTQHYINGIKNEAVTGLHDLIEAANSKLGADAMRRVGMFLFDVQNPRMTHDLALEVFDRGSGATGNSLAKTGAEAWLNTIEPLRQRFNAAGGDVGKLDYGYLPTLHDSLRVLKAGRDEWVKATMPLVDRSRYYNPDGSRSSDADVEDMLRAAWETISSDGLNKTQPGQFKGTGSRANAGSKSREIHFKDGEAYVAYHEAFGRGSMYDAMLGHINKITRDIGLVERYGPNPEAQMRLQFDLGVRADGNKQAHIFANTPEAYWSVISGTAGVPQSARVASLGAGIRSLQTMGKLGGALLSSVTDLGTYAVTTGYNDLPYWQAVANIGRSASKDTRDFMAAHGIIAESMIGDLNRYAGDYLTTGVMSRLAGATMKLSGLNVWTDTLRNAFQLTMMQGMAKLSRTDWSAMSEFDRFRMQQHGISEADWSVIRQAPLTTHRGHDFLTPEAIRGTGDARAGEIVAKVLGMIRDEGEYAVVNPDLATKAAQTWGGQQAGTGMGELARSVMQFKSFPIAMISRHWRRMIDTPNVEGRPIAANPLAYGAALGVTLMGLGAIATQEKQIASGKDPIDMTGEHAAKFWLKAFVQGGGASIIGDMILTDTTENGTGFAVATLKNLTGPGISTVLESAAIVKDNADRAVAGKDTKLGADLTRVARSNLPFLSIWYAKAAIDHMGLHALQENLSPGYLSRMKQRARKEFGQDYWWAPGTGGPERAPDIGKAVGQ